MSTEICALKRGTMKVVILAGGLGARFCEETNIKPKPMVEIGGFPILWHIMKIYGSYGFNEFVILTGYKQEVIKNYFLNYYMNNSDVTFDFAANSVEVHKNRSEPWKVTLLDTGGSTLTAGRIKRAKDFIGNEPFMLTYGDGVGNVDIPAVLKQHKNSGNFCTLTAYQQEGRFGTININEQGTVMQFQEKPKESGIWVNAGFFVCEPQVFDYIPENADNIMWEQEPLKSLAGAGKLGAYKHTGFWHPMDMLRDKEDLDKLWTSGKAPWKIWKD